MNRQTFSREGFITDLSRRILEPEEVIGGEEGVKYANRKDDRTLTFRMVAFDVVERAHLTVDSRILEVCCGAGQLVHELSKFVKPQNIIAVDGSKELIEIAKSRYGSDGIRFEVQNVHDLNVPGNFDCVVCKDSFHHFPDPKTAIVELMKPLKNGGLLYIFDLVRNASDESINTRQSAILDDHEAMRFLRSVNASLITKEFIQVVSELGLNIEVIYPLTYSEANKKNNEESIKLDKIKEINTADLFAVYLLRN